MTPSRQCILITPSCNPSSYHPPGNASLLHPHAIYPQNTRLESILITLSMKCILIASSFNPSSLHTRGIASSVHPPVNAPSLLLLQSILITPICNASSFHPPTILPHFALQALYPHFTLLQSIVIPPSRQCILITPFCNASSLHPPAIHSHYPPAIHPHHTLQAMHYQHTLSNASSLDPLEMHPHCTLQLYNLVTFSRQFILKTPSCNITPSLLQIRRESAVLKRHNNFVKEKTPHTWIVVKQNQYSRLKNAGNQVEKLSYSIILWVKSRYGES